MNLIILSDSNIFPIQYFKFCMKFKVFSGVFLRFPPFFGVFLCFPVIRCFFLVYLGTHEMALISFLVKRFRLNLLYHER